jgi:hypothetical protein
MRECCSVNKCLSLTLKWTNKITKNIESLTCSVYKEIEKKKGCKHREYITERKDMKKPNSILPLWDGGKLRLEDLGELFCANEANPIHFQWR